MANWGLAIAVHGAGADADADDEVAAVPCSKKQQEQVISRTDLEGSKQFIELSHKMLSRLSTQVVRYL